MDLTPNPIIVPMTVSSNMQSVPFEASSNRQPVPFEASVNVILKPTKTSELINDGEDGTSKYVESDDLSIALDSKQDVLTFDNTPTEGSLNPVTSGGIYNVLKDIPDYYTLHITVINQTENMISFSIPQEEHTAILTAYNNHDNFVVLMNVTINNVQYSLVAFPCRTEQLFNFNALVFAVPSKDNGFGETSFFTVAISLQYPNGILVINNIDFELLSTLIGQKEDKNNKVQSITSESTINQYPSAKAVYDALENKQDLALIIHATQIGESEFYQIDKTTNEILEAISQGRYVALQTIHSTYPYTLTFTFDNDTYIAFGVTLNENLILISDGFIISTTQNFTQHITSIKTLVTSVNGNEGDITITASSIGAIPANDKGRAYGVAELDVNGKVPTDQLPTIPTKTSDLTNDSDFISESEVDTKLATKADSAGASANYAAKLTASIPYGELDSTSTATVMTATVPGITELKNGVCMMLKNGVITSAANFTININGLGAKPVYQTMAAASRITTTFNVAYTMLFTYNEDRVDGGCWDMYYGYYTNTNTIGYQLRTNSSRLPSADRTGRYRLLFTSADNTHWVPGNTSDSTSATSAKTVNQRPIDPFGQIIYYGYTSVIAAESMPGAAYMWQQYVVTLGYTFTPIALNDFVPLYLKCVPQVNGSAIIDSTTPVVQALPSTNDGFIYIYLGIATSTTAFELSVEHPVYYHDGARIRFWTGSQEIPPAPSTDGTYSLKCIVNNGVVTYSWVND